MSAFTSHLQLIRSTGVKSGVVLNPHTPVETILHVLDEVDLVLFMTVIQDLVVKSLFIQFFRK